jgi:hypothetical protein
MFSKILDNIKGWPTTIVGVSTIIATIASNQGVQQIASLSPQAGAIVSGVGAVAAGLTLIFGTGAKK